MRLLADECCERRPVVALCDAGHDVLYMVEYRPGMPDLDVVALARTEARILITDAKDFGELIVRRRVPCAGIVLLRIDPIDFANRIDALIGAIARFGDRLGRQVTVLRGNVVRVRMIDN